MTYWLLNEKNGKVIEKIEIPKEIFVKLKSWGNFKTHRLLCLIERIMEEGK